MRSPKCDRPDSKAPVGRRGSRAAAARGLALVHRYFFYWWLFRDASAGTYWERAAALAHNRKHADWLLRYVVRWLAVAILLLALARFFELLFASRILSASLCLLAVVAVARIALTAACWLLLRSGR